MNEITVTDHLGDEWRFLIPVKFKRNRNGLMVMWVGKGAAKLTSPPYNYQQLPFPVFTEWWHDHND